MKNYTYNLMLLLNTIILQYIILILNTIYICVCVYIYILILSSLEKEGNPNICDNMDKP